MPELTAEMIPEFGGGFGLFGLQDAKIQLMLEGLPFAEEILPMEYNFYEANCLLQNAEMQEVNKTQLSDADNISSTHLKRRLYEEISAWGFAKGEKWRGQRRAKRRGCTALAPCMCRSLSPRSSH